MRELSELLRRHLVLPLNEMGIPIDLRGVQAALVLLPIVVVAFTFARTSSKKRQRMKDAGM